MLNYNKVEMRYEPYPLAILRPALAADTYDELARNFPDASMFGTLNKFPYKLSLSEKFAPENYTRFLRENKPWNRFYSWIKSDTFIRNTIDFLNSNHVELPVDNAFEEGSAKLKRIGRALAKGRLPHPSTKLRSRFEFSVLKADGGVVEPHTDAAKKIITLVVSMIRDGEWNPVFGGGLDMNRATDNKYAYNWNNRIVPWDKIEVVETIPFVPNQCVLFVKTFNSLHSVRRMTQTGSEALRKTVTIVIERDD